MAHRRGNVLALQLLASVAQDAFEIILPLALENRSGLVGNIAIRLKFIAEDLSNQELSKIPLDAQIVSAKALRDLFQIATWPPPKLPWIWSQKEEDPQVLRRKLGHLLQNEVSRLRVQESVTKFCKERPYVIQPFELRFAHLSGLLAKNIPGSQRTLTDAAAYSDPPPRDVYPGQVHKLFLKGVKSHAACRLEGHVEPGPRGTASTNWHITRLCLESGFLSEDQRVLFRIVTTTSKMTHWQELAFRVPIMNTKSKHAQELQQGSKNTFTTTEISLIESGDTCKDLDRPTYARTHIELDEACHLYQLQDPERLQYIISGRGVPLSELLKLGDLTVEQKIKLSYTIARAFWQFYTSELMDARWTSEDILLFRLDQELFSPEDILLRTFVSLPFGNQYKESPAEYYDKGLHTHRFPRILYLGVILLEIGLGETLGAANSSDFGSVEHTNKIHMKAGLKLRKLKAEKWDGFASKDCFVEAVENCLESFNFKNTTNRVRSRDQSYSSEEPDLSERRDALYRKVVAPLYRLATVGFEVSEEPPLIRIPNQARTKSISTNDGELQDSWGEIRDAHSSFLSGPSGSNKGFLDHLQLIAGHITRCRRLAKTTKRIRVAILDTGCRKELPFFEDDRRGSRLKGWKDFTLTGSQSAIDTFGHGTFMARLLMHVAPIADIYIIRVAEDTDDLEKHGQQIVNAIIHAGLDPEWKADIISMSFGIPYERKQECEAILDAIEKVTKERDGSVLFFAAAGNSGIRKENFPACHNDVISIYATNSDGVFLGLIHPSTKTGLSFSVFMALIFPSPSWMKSGHIFHRQISVREAQLRPLLQPELPP